MFICNNISCNLMSDIQLMLIFLYTQLTHMKIGFTTCSFFLANLHLFMFCHRCDMHVCVCVVSVGLNERLILLDISNCFLTPFNVVDIYLHSRNYIASIFLYREDANNSLFCNVCKYLPSIGHIQGDINHHPKNLTSHVQISSISI
jgi:hypothetical protein